MIARILALSLIGGLFGLTLSLAPAAAEPHAAVNARGGVAVKGYDMVAFFTQHRALKGDARFAYDYEGARWLFANEADRDAFAAAPGQYAPQYGGYCAYAMAGGRFADVNPKEWRIRDGKLYLNNNIVSQKLWDGAPARKIAHADAHWREKSFAPAGTR